MCNLFLLPHYNIVVKKQTEHSKFV